MSETTPASAPLEPAPKRNCYVGLADPRVRRLSVHGLAAVLWIDGFLEVPALRVIALIGVCLGASYFISFELSRRTDRWWLFGIANCAVAACAISLATMSRRIFPPESQEWPVLVAIAELAYAMVVTFDVGTFVVGWIDRKFGNVRPAEPVFTKETGVMVMPPKPAAPAGNSTPA